MEKEYPFIKAAVKAHIDRCPDNEKLGKPYQTILQIMGEQKTKQFDIIFKEFNKRLPIYGYGDVQVKRLFDIILNDIIM